MIRWIKKKYNRTSRKMKVLESLSNLRPADLAENEYHIYEEIPEHDLTVPTPLFESIVSDCPVCRYSPKDDIPCVCQDTKIPRSIPASKDMAQVIKQAAALTVSPNKIPLHRNRKYNHVNRPLPEIPSKPSTPSVHKKRLRNSADLNSCDSNNLSSIELETDADISHRLDNLYINMSENMKSLYMNSEGDRRHSIISTDSGFGGDYSFSHGSSALSSCSSLSNDDTSCLEDVIYENIASLTS